MAQANSYFEAYRSASQALLSAVSPAEVAAVCDVLYGVFERGGTVFACGNGGSASTAGHFIEDLAKLMWHPESGRRLKCQALTESTPLITALANDDGYARIFEIQLAVLASPGDAIVCISGSGNSPNILRAADYAGAHGMHAVAMTGFDGGTLRATCPVGVHVPSHNMGMLEGVHLLVLDYISKEMRHRAYGVAHPLR
jgi:D-sedoheptulose 7-phosphate isomerase